jgi:thioredoxin reductase (NADPH)
MPVDRDGNSVEEGLMASVAVIGDGPGGLSAALFLAKNGHEVTVFGIDKTAMHYAHLYNYLGVPEIPGTQFQKIAREQVVGFGATIHEEEVSAVEPGELFTVTTATAVTRYEYLILTEGKNPVLARSLGLDSDDSGAIVVDRDYRSSIERVYVVGRSARPARSQAIISAGAGATAALDILAREAGENVQDWDSPPEG